MKAQFIRTDAPHALWRVPEGPAWLYELNLDGYPAIAFKSAGKVHLRSRNDKDFSGSYPQIARALNAVAKRPNSMYEPAKRSRT